MREEWRRNLSKVQAGNITANYKYIRKRDGRENRIYGPQCSAPLLNNGVAHADPRKTSELLA